MAVHALGELVEEVRNATEPPISLRSLSKAAGMSPSGLAKLIRQPMEEMPKPETIRGLARALNVPEWQVIDACLRSVDLVGIGELDGRATVYEMRRILDVSPVLTDDEREMWEFLVRRLERRIAKERQDADEE